VAGCFRPEQGKSQKAKVKSDGAWRIGLAVFDAVGEGFAGWFGSCRENLTGFLFLF
jgi:hypothetical protein